MIPKSMKKLRHRIINYTYRTKAVEEIFTEIYDKKVWGEVANSKYSSGSGTTNPNTELYKNMLIDFLKSENVKSIFEIGCGDFTIMNDVLVDNCNSIEYTGCDIVKPLIEYNNKYSSGNIKFIHMDAISAESLPIADLCLIRQVFQHLNNNQIAEILSKVNKFKFLIISEHIPVHPEIKNKDKKPGPDIRLYQKSGVFLDAPPFSLECQTLLEYREDFIVFDEPMPATIRTSLIKSIK